MNSTKTHNKIYSINEREINFYERTYVMGILNVTPDSFSDGGKYFSVDSAVERALQMIEEGADIIDIGGESTRPSGVYGITEQVQSDEELRRVIPVLEKLSQHSDCIISIDTYKSEVAEAALHSGAHIVNDISGLKFDEKIASVVAQHSATLVVMHIQGTPQTMQIHPQYENVVNDVFAELQQSITKAQNVGVHQIIVDVGIGFGKNLQHNLLLLKNLERFTTFGFPVLIGTSRKGFIGQILNLPVNERLEGTAASSAAAIMNGANIIRVHDVKEMKRVAMIVDAIKNVGR